MPTFHVKPIRGGLSPVPGLPGGPSGREHLAPPLVSAPEPASNSRIPPPAGASRPRPRLPTAAHQGGAGRWRRIVSRETSAGSRRATAGWEGQGSLPRAQLGGVTTTRRRHRKRRQCAAPVCSTGQSRSRRSTAQSQSVSRETSQQMPFAIVGLCPLETWPLRRHTGPPGKDVRAQRDLVEDPIGGAAG